MTISNGLRRGWRYARVFILALLTPLFEKNPSKMKTLSRCQVPMVLSMARVIVLLFAAVMLAHVRNAGVTGWPAATLSIAIVLAIPFLSALERIRPEQAVKVMETVVNRFGVGSTGTEPSKFDDHRDDRQLKVVQ
jgi:hypothetical protein